MAGVAAGASLSGDVLDGAAAEYDESEGDQEPAYGPAEMGHALLRLSDGLRFWLDRGRLCRKPRIHQRLAQNVLRALRPRLPEHLVQRGDEFGARPEPVAGQLLEAALHDAIERGRDARDQARQRHRGVVPNALGSAARPIVREGA